MAKATVNPKTRKTVAIDITRIKNACFAIKKDERFHKTEEAIFNALKELIEEYAAKVKLPILWHNGDSVPIVSYVFDFELFLPYMLKKGFYFFVQFR